MLLKSIDKTISSASELYQSYKRPIILFIILIIFSYVLYYIYNAYVLPLLNIKYSDNKNYYPSLIVTGGASVLFIVIKILINAHKSRKKKKLNFYSNMDEQAV